MPLTKSEFERLREERDRAQSAMKDRPRINNIGAINEGGGLDLHDNMLNPTETRSLYEMLRAWYGDSLMTEKAKAVIEAADALRNSVGPVDEAACRTELTDAVDAYRAEQKQ